MAFLLLDTGLGRLRLSETEAWACILHEVLGDEDHIFFCVGVYPGGSAPKMSGRRKWSGFYKYIRERGIPNVETYIHPHPSCLPRLERPSSYCQSLLSVSISISAPRAADIHPTRRGLPVTPYLAAQEAIKSRAIFDCVSWVYAALMLGSCSYRQHCPSCVASFHSPELL